MRLRTCIGIGAKSPRCRLGDGRRRGGRVMLSLVRSRIPAYNVPLNLCNGPSGTTRRRSLSWRGERMCMTGMIKKFRIMIMCITTPRRRR
jgi:hypothetical protein